MSLFEDKNLVIRSRIIEEPGCRIILEISFEGIHDHRWPAGERIQEFIESEVRKARPVAGLFDFRGYDYAQGDEIGAPIMAVIGHGAWPLRPIAIVATGQTARLLKSLHAGSNLDKITDIGFFEDTASGCAFLQQALDKRGKLIRSGP